MSRIRKLLIVENNPEHLRPRRELFEREGWTVMVADTPQAAFEILTQGWVHLAIVDIRLKDDNDMSDTTGLDLIRSTDPAIPKIVWTAFPSYETATEALGLNADGIPWAVYFVDKAKGYRELELKVEAVFRDKVRINTELEMVPESGVSLEGLLSEIEDYRDLPQDRLGIMTEELGDLMRKLFVGAECLALQHVIPGAGGSGVVKAQPSMPGGAGEPAIVKFGKRDNMRREVGNLIRYVQPYAGQHSTALIGELCETLHFAGAKFSLVGRAGADTRDFNAFYREASAEAVTKTMVLLFEGTCGRWYNGRRDWADPDLDQRPWTFDVEGLRGQADSLALSFDKQKGLGTEPRAQKLVRALEAVYTGGTVCRSQFRRTDAIHFEVTFSGSKERLRLPDPVQYIKTQRHTFPPPTFWAITHGDLHGRNILVDNEGQSWLIDFFKTGWGPAIRDIAQLEAAIRLELLDTDNLFALSRFEEACLKVRGLDQDIEFTNEFRLPEFDKAISAITCLRRLAFKVNQLPDMREYYVALLYHTLRLSTWAGARPEERRRFNIRQRHSLMGAGLICERLRRWDDEDLRVIL